MEKSILAQRNADNSNHDVMQMPKVSNKHKM